MSSTITAASPAGHIAAAAVPPPKAPAPAKAPAAEVAAQTTATLTAGSATAQQQAALNRMLVAYARDQSRNMDAATLRALARQIQTAAKALGLHVTLPHAPASAANASATSTANTAPAKGKVNVTA